MKYSMPVVKKVLVVKTSGNRGCPCRGRSHKMDPFG